MRARERILHAPTNIANMAWVFAEEQRRRGHRVDVAVKTPAKRGFNYDVNLQMSMFTRQTFWRVLRRILYLFKFLLFYDVYFFYYSESLSSLLPFLPKYWDLPLLRLLGRKIFMFTNGSDIIPEKALHCEKFMNGGCGTCYGCEDRGAKEEGIKIAKRYVHILFTSCRCIEFSRNGAFDRKINEMIINPVDIHKFPFVGVGPLKGGAPITVVHAPSRLDNKGTAEIQETVSRLKKEYPIDLIVVHNTPQQEAIEIYKKADIVVDHLTNGWYGSFSLEAMSLGKPLMTNIREDLFRLYGDRIRESSIVNVNKENIEGELRRLLCDPERRSELSRKGRAFVEKHHAVGRIVDRFENLYQPLSS